MTNYTIPPGHARREALLREWRRIGFHDPMQRRPARFRALEGMPPSEDGQGITP